MEEASSSFELLFDLFLSRAGDFFVDEYGEERDGEIEGIYEKLGFFLVVMKKMGTLKENYRKKLKSC